MEKKRFICVAPSKEQFNVDNESLGMSGERAIYYSPLIGRRRLYRQPLGDAQNGMMLLTYATEKRAQEVCDSTNFHFNDEFMVREYVGN